MNPERLLGHMQRDKKTLAGEMTFILPKGIGKVAVKKGVKAADVEKVLIH
jgi:3-dehydroquinate synthetase